MLAAEPRAREEPGTAAAAVLPSHAVVRTGRISASSPTTVAPRDPRRDARATTSSASTRSAGRTRSSRAASDSSAARARGRTASTWKRRTTRVIVAPVPVDVANLRAEADEPDVQSWVGSARRAARRTQAPAARRPHRPVQEPVARVPRVRAAARAAPKLVNEVLFLALLYPSRLSVERYQHYYSECLGVVRRINERWDTKVKSDVGPSTCSSRTTIHRSLARDAAVRRAAREPRLRRAEPREQGGRRRERARRLGDPVAQRRCVRGDRLRDAPGAIRSTSTGRPTRCSPHTRCPQMRARRARNACGRSATRTTPSDWLATRLSAAGL